MILLFQRGDTPLSANYQPASLLAVGYELLASMIHQRLLDGGAESRMRGSQFGFRPKRGTSDALMLIRRMIDAAYSDRNGGMLLVMLDWAKKRSTE